MRRRDLFFMAAAMTAVTVVGTVSGQTTPLLTYTSTGVESNWALPGAWECIDDLGQPCSGQPEYPQDADHEVVIEHPVFLDLRGSNLEIGRLDIFENGSGIAHGGEYRWCRSIHRG